MRSIVQKIVIGYGRQHALLTIRDSGAKFVGRLVTLGARSRWSMRFHAADEQGVMELAVSYVLERACRTRVRKPPIRRTPSRQQSACLTSSADSR
jgi:hypothetical protein